MKAEFEQALIKEVHDVIKLCCDEMTKIKFNFVMTNKEFEEYLDRLQKLEITNPLQGVESAYKIISDIKNNRTSYGLCTKKPVQVEFREVRKDEKSIATLEGNLYCNRDKHFIIKGVNGEEYPIEKDIFYKTYEVDKPCSSVE